MAFTNIFSFIRVHVNFILKSWVQREVFAWQCIHTHVNHRMNVDCKYTTPKYQHAAQQLQSADQCLPQYQSSLRFHRMTVVWLVVIAQNTSKHYSANSLHSIQSRRSSAITYSYTNRTSSILCCFCSNDLTLGFPPLESAQSVRCLIFCLYLSCTGYNILFDCQATLLVYVSTDIYQYEHSCFNFFFWFFTTFQLIQNVWITRVPTNILNDHSFRDSV